MVGVVQIPKKAKLANLINYRVRVTTLDSSQFIGTLMSFDRHLNVVLSECEEFRLTKKSKFELRKKKSTSTADMTTAQPATEEIKRYLGLTILRGETIISVTVESAPNLNNLKPELRLNKGKGSIKPLKTLDGGVTSGAVKKSVGGVSISTTGTGGGRLNTPLKTTDRVTKPARGGMGQGRGGGFGGNNMRRH